MADEQPPAEALPSSVEAKTREPVIVQLPSGEAQTPGEPVVVSASPNSPTQPANQVLFSASVATAAFSLPLPPPEVLKQFTELIPDAPERFLAMVEQEGKDRRKQEAIKLQAEIEDRKAQRAETRRGQYCALAIGLGVPLLGVIAGIYGAPWTGAIIGAGGVAAIVTAFLRGPSISSAAERKQ